MIYCINPDCKQRQNPNHIEHCQACGTPLVISGYQLLKPLRALDPRSYTEIFEAEDRKGTRKVIKVLKDSSTQLVEMFVREAFTLQLLNHPGIPKVEIDGYFTFTPKDSTQEIHCLAMEKIEGKNLEQWLTEHGRISQDIALNWLRQLIEIIEVLHKKHFFHRDIKPSNIILKPDGRLVLIDFGSVRGITNTYLAKIKQQTITAIISGGYTPPEQIDSQAVPQSDFYALGRTFIHLLTGKSPLELPKDSRTGKLIWKKQAPQIFQPLADFIDEMVEFFPFDRPQNTAVILRSLTLRGLFVKSILRNLNSPLFKVSIAALLLAGIFYRLSFPGIAQYYYDLGVKAQQSQQLFEAKKYYEQALAFNPQDSKIVNNLGLICQTIKDFACAQLQYEKAVKLNPLNPVARYNLGGFYDDSGEFDRATVQYELAIQSNSPVAVNALSDLARLRILDGDAAAAIELSLRGLQQTQKPKVRSALYRNLGWARWVQNDYSQAEADLQQAIKLNPERTDAYCLLAQVLEAKDDNKGALILWKKCLNRNSNNSREVKVWQTIAQQRINDSR
ncbi:MAG: tetratricopeptide repeat protein [Microcoleus sp. PH2017_10_PVI_O_A]|uniref:serine/threonine-protein kinase n=1 Tax=unclassified Microcoleus TaxID=2642155 RepID=UPI001DE613F5|nr:MULTISPECIES: serine/threonine-protein kinase [unclassified Microcoleus]TAE74507.1 MAG: serine/threonine-protein kinase [Oscillatoriales cyanobacterium]MCC3409709.1 tetratricopeptide repeat protein [Microcoleus sp. PH2017_10_PVI_O_A]MCC3463407.1 tetratricopeptide repeat protein [Microcoleus sp. PH2017_11_PCY_U_A]MCC3481774.1 tetratricopeptide repeat protein [Microcoleus sp. PH2017_12_PCY_D_A]MCC3562707.1 tetratricopeptide repeat protein [Microcoleus sp. PH2017_27_LUM_O_A]